MNTTEAARRTEGGLGSPSSGRLTRLSAVGFWSLSLAVFWRPLANLASLSFHDERSSHILLIPLISACLLFIDRRKILRRARRCLSLGLPLLLLAAILWFILQTPLSRLASADRLSAVASLIYLVWIAGFLLFFGLGAFQEAIFPLLFLLLMIPIPVALADGVVVLLQKGSAATCYALFRLLGVPVIRHGFQFSLPGVDIEVAQQCSGIHSALALFIAGLLLQHFLLQGSWKTAFFIACIFPVAIFKNAVRIVTIAWLGIHVSPNFFHGQLHRQGGLPFGVLAVVMLGLILWALRRLRFRGAEGI